MVKLFDIENGNVVMSPVMLWIPEFKKIWDRDTTETKEVAVREISYIVFLHGFKSPYTAYSEKEREKKILNDYFKGEKWKPDSAVKAAIKKYNELQDSLILRLLRSARKGLEVIDEFLSNATPEEVDRVTKNIKELGGLVTSLNKLEETAKKEQSENSAKGGQDIGFFE